MAAGARMILETHYDRLHLWGFNQWWRTRIAARHLWRVISGDVTPCGKCGATDANMEHTCDDCGARVRRCTECCEEARDASFDDHWILQPCGHLISPYEFDGTWRDLDIPEKL